VIVKLGNCRDCHFVMSYTYSFCSGSTAGSLSAVTCYTCCTNLSACGARCFLQPGSFESLLSILSPLGSGTDV